jgi:hypothetical protein
VGTIKLTTVDACCAILSLAARVPVSVGISDAVTSVGFTSMGIYHSVPAVVYDIVAGSVRYLTC